MDAEFLRALARLRESRVLAVNYGNVLREDDVCGVRGSQTYVEGDPLVVVMEFLRLQTLRVADLFTTLQTDGSKTVTTKRFRQEIMVSMGGGGGVLSVTESEYISSVIESLRIRIHRLQNLPVTESESLSRPLILLFIVNYVYVSRTLKQRCSIPFSVTTFILNVPLQWESESASESPSA